jgi:allantoinase
VLPEGVREAVVVVEDGVIAEVLPGDGPADEDLGDLVLMAGLVDTHVHVNEPGRTEWEGFETATRAAAAGGITTVVDMPLNCVPVTTTAPALRAKLSACAPILWVDCAFWGGVIPGNAPDLGALVDAGVLGAKCFLIHSGIDDFPNVTEADLRLAMPELASRGVPLLVHAELELPGRVPSGPVDTYDTFLASRPATWEDAAISLMVRLCRDTGCAVHVVHLSSASALPILAAAKAEGLPITVETCPHYLCLEAEGVPSGATEFKCCPPIRGAENRERLWQGLADGTIDAVISDHSPCSPHLKLPEQGDFLGAWGGIASLQLGLSTVWTEARRRGFGVGHLAEWMCLRPAEIAGLGHRKGRIARGWDADLVAWDPELRFVVRAAGLHHRHKITPYVGREMSGQAVTTWVRGARVYDRGTWSAAPLGQIVLRAALDAPVVWSRLQGG